MDAPTKSVDESEQTITIVLPSASYTFARATEQNLTEVRPSQETGFDQPSELVVCER